LGKWVNDLHGVAVLCCLTASVVGIVDLNATLMTPGRDIMLLLIMSIF